MIHLRPNFNLPHVVVPVYLRVTLVSVGVGLSLIGILSRILARRRRKKDPALRSHLITNPKANSAPWKHYNGDVNQVKNSPPSQSYHHRRQASITSEHLSTASTLTLPAHAPPVPLSPQQLGVMGMEALETALGYWEDALKAYTSNDPTSPAALTDAQEGNFTHLLQKILDKAYHLQDHCSQLFLYENSVLFRCDSTASFRHQEMERRGTVPTISSADSFVSAQAEVSSTISSSSSACDTFVSLPPSEDEIDDSAQSEKSSKKKRKKRSSASSTVSSSSFKSAHSSGNESFKSASSAIANIHDFDDEESLLAESFILYKKALKLLETEMVPCRISRATLLKCQSETDFLAKLHCVRQAFTLVFECPENQEWFAYVGRSMLIDLFTHAKKDHKGCVAAYDEFLKFTAVPDNWPLIEEELSDRGLTCFTFYDTVLDFIILDAFEDLESPPSSVNAVIQNRWLSSGFKESALATAVWSVLKAKRRLLRHSKGFISHFYSVTEYLSPVLAWGFFGPNEELREICIYFKEEVVGFLSDVFNLDRVRYTNLQELSADIVTVAHERYQSSCQRLQLIKDHWQQNMAL